MMRFGPEGALGTWAASTMLTALSSMTSTAVSAVCLASSLAICATASGFLPVTLSVITRFVVAEVTLMS